MYMLIMLLAVAGHPPQVSAYPQLIPDEQTCKAALVASKKEVDQLSAQVQAQAKTEFRCVKLD
jgi:hypothetical protein